MSGSGLKAYNVADLRRLARRKLPRGLFEYVDRGTEDEHALRAMTRAIERLKFQPQVLVDVSARSAQSDFFGIPTQMPVAVAPTGAAGLLWHDGEIALARAAHRAGIPFTLSTASIISMERVAAEAGGTGGADEPVQFPALTCRRVFGGQPSGAPAAAMARYTLPFSGAAAMIGMSFDAGLAPSPVDAEKVVALDAMNQE